MCGICGLLNPPAGEGAADRLLDGMLRALRHRGPDDTGRYGDEGVRLGSARLSIIDLAGGHQPLANEDGTLWIAFNGEIFNYLELREELASRGHRFRTKTDTEVVLHLYEEMGPGCLSGLNGQFAFALWDRPRRQLLLARDRPGILPLYYAESGDSLLFASEVKALYADRRLRRALDPHGLDQLFTFWATTPPRTAFAGVRELPAGCYLLARDGGITVKRWWDPVFPAAGEAPPRRPEAAAEELSALLRDSIRLRLRADVPVGAYVSGGLDSSLLAAMARRHFTNELQSFSVGFTDRELDETAWQREVAEFLGTRHDEVRCGPSDVGRLLPQVVWHAESPLVRTAPAPLFRLSERVRGRGLKVVLTGEGADELLGGYDLFKENKIRRFWARNPDSRWRASLLRRLHSRLADASPRSLGYLEAFYRRGLGDTGLEHYSHLPRWTTTAWVKGLYSPAMKEALAGYDAVEELRGRLPAEFRGWDPLAQAQYLELKTLLAGNLLSAQGDRMLMAHSVEGRFPYLDHRLMEFCFALPPWLKLNGLREKHLLQQAAGPYLPPAIRRRRKQAYRAPDSASLFSDGPREMVEALLAPGHLADTGYFDPPAVAALARKCRAAGGSALNAREEIAVVGIVSTLLLDRLFVRGLPA